jgi:endonuclease-3
MSSPARKQPARVSSSSAVDDLKPTKRISSSSTVDDPKPTKRISSTQSPPDSKKKKTSQPKKKSSGPTEASIRATHDALVLEYGHRPAPTDRRDILNALVGTILSQNTTDKQAHVAFAALKVAFPRWTEVLHAREGAVEEVVKSAGLADIKMGRVRVIIQSLLDGEAQFKDTDGEPSLESLHHRTTDEVKAFLGGLKGVGPKTVSCVLLFAMNRDDFPVDTHVLKLAVALKWILPNTGREAAYDILDACVPADIKYSLHVHLVHHGKVTKNKLGILAPSKGKGIVDDDEEKPTPVTSLKGVGDEKPKDEKPTSVVSSGTFLEGLGEGKKK